MSLTCNHADTCLPSYWGGHHLPHIQVPVYRGMLFKDLISALHSELSQGAVAGNYNEDDEAWHEAAKAAIDAITLKDETIEDAQNEPLFMDLEEQDEDDDDGSESVYAFFVFTEEDPA